MTAPHQRASDLTRRAAHLINEASLLEARDAIVAKFGRIEIDNAANNPVVHGGLSVL